MRKAWGASHSASLTKRAKKAAGKKQVPVPSPQALDQSLSEDVDSGNQASDLNGLEGMMDMLVDISSQLQATEKGMKEMRAERAAAHTQSLSITWQDVHID